MNYALRVSTALLSGLIFGLGLSLSGMLDPVRVRGFLDIAGDWDPSLMFVLGGAVAISAAGFLISRRFRQPLFDIEYRLPQHAAIDGRLVAGAAIFGVGWGIGGLCPGPAIASLTLGLTPIFVFTIAMLVGMLFYDRFWSLKTSSIATKA